MAETVVHFQLRMPPALHERLASRAKEEKSSLNAYIVGLLHDVLDPKALDTKPASGLVASGGRDGKH
jgi:hypothetical protein